MNRTLDLLTEVHPDDDDKFLTHFTRMCLKLILLKDVFIDRDYGDKDKRCVVPYLWEMWFARLIENMGSLPCKKLSIYGAMYPSISEAIIRSSPSLTTLVLSNINITDDLLLTVSRFCPNLEKLYLQAIFPWMVLSIEGFCAAFFKGQTYDYLVSCLEQKQAKNIPLSFTNLKEIELGYGSSRTCVVDFHLLILSFYKNVKFVFSQWKANFFEEGYENYCEDVVQESISRSGTLSIETLFMKADYLCELSHADINYLLWNCPLLNDIKIDCNVSSSRFGANSVKNIGEKLSYFGRESMNITSVYANVAVKERITQSVLGPFLNSGVNLTDVTLEANNTHETMSITLISQILKTCTTLEKLRIRVWARSMIEYPSVGFDKFNFPTCEHLSELWLHEDGPGDDDEVDYMLWLHLLYGLLAGAPNLMTLSFTMCQGLKNMIDQLFTSAQRVHVHLKDGYEWNFSIKQLNDFILRQPNLKILHLEEVSAKVFWRLKELYSSTQLNLHWGNLDGLPRS